MTDEATRLARRARREADARSNASETSAARDWNPCAHEGGCLGSASAGDRCLVHHGGGDTALARKRWLAGERLDLRGCVVPEGWFSTLLPRYEFEPPPLLVDASLALFEGPLTFRVPDNVFLDGTTFDSAIFEGPTVFDGSVFEGAVSFKRAVFEERGTFSRATFSGSTTFSRAQFDRAASFAGCNFAVHADFHEAVFGESSQLLGMSFRRGADFQRATMSAMRMNVTLDGWLNLSEITAHGTLALTWWGDRESKESPRVVLDGARLMDRCAIRGEGVLSMAAVDIRAPSTVSPTQGTLELFSIADANVEHVALEDVSLELTDFTNAVRLAQLSFEGDIRFAKADRPTRRDALSAELVSPPAPPRRLEGQYRALRKAREDSGDYPGASDFFYGQMLSRLRATSNPAERVVLGLYRRVGGFGVRASRPLLTLALLICLGTLVFDLWGLRGADFGESLELSLQAATSLARPVDSPDLQGIGFATAFTLRILGPILAGFAILALRARVRR